jgi:sortase, srtB family
MLYFYLKVIRRYMNKKFFLPVSVFIIVLIAIAVILNIINRNKKVETIIETVTETTTEPETTTEAPTKAYEADENYKRKIDFTSLKETNPDVVAWVYVPGTVIDYPVLWKEYDIDYYLHRDINHKESYYSIYMDGYSNADFSTLNNIIYGHHMKDGRMFTDITKFKNEDFFKEHRMIYIYTPQKTYRLKTFAALYSDSAPERRQTYFDDMNYFHEYIDRMTNKCTYRDIPASGIDKIWSFITCSYEGDDTRTILYAYELNDDDEPQRYDLADIDFGEDHR